MRVSCYPIADEIELNENVICVPIANIATYTIICF